MKKLLIAALVLIAAYLVGAVVFAVANGQAEGAVLNPDKQLLADGDMEKSGTSAWSATRAVLSKEFESPVDGTRVIKLTATASSPVAYQAVLTEGKTYKVTGLYQSDGTLVCYIGGVEFGTSITWENFELIFTASSNILGLYGRYGGAGNWIKFDNVFITEYTGDMTDADQQVLVDGDFEKSGTSDWNVGNGTITKEPGSAKDGSRILRITRGSEVSAPVVSPNPAILVVGNTYHITGWARSDGNETPRIRDTGAGFSWMGTVSTVWQRVDFVGTPLSPTLQLRASAVAGTIGNYVEFDDLFVTEYTGDMTNANQQLLVDGDMEKSGTAKWTSVQGAVLSKEVGGPGDGDRVLRLTSSSVADPGAYQNNISVGSRYRMTGWARTDSSREVHFGDRLDIDGCAAVTVGTDWTFIDCTFTAIFAASRVGFSSSATDQWAEYDNVLITEI